MTGMYKTLTRSEAFPHLGNSSMLVSYELIKLPVSNLGPEQLGQKEKHDRGTCQGLATAMPKPTSSKV